MINLNNTKLIGAEISRRSYEFRLNFMNLYLKEHPNDMEGYAGYESTLFFLAVCHDADYCIKRILLLIALPILLATVDIVI